MAVAAVVAVSFSLVKIIFMHSLMDIIGYQGGRGGGGGGGGYEGRGGGGGGGYEGGNSEFSGLRLLQMAKVLTFS